MNTPVWDPHQYLRYADERTRPLHDLLTRVPTLPHEPAPTVLDIGCGPGNSTALLRRRWPHARLTGIDNSADMLTTARTTGEPTAHYQLADATHYDPADTHPDLIASNATLQWIPGHLDLLPRWAATLPPGGVIALQVPGNFDSPSHTALTELRHSPRWHD
ncbi:methyltransferase domain-containing protein, partial [Kitasatospora sp. A2-31]|uniref:methyltransferase domain-containing protein n=1 Tax=Kitasatospora sp. A2-31 TaxID=2916414 RepID=UPI001EEEB217